MKRIVQIFSVILFAVFVANSEELAPGTVIRDAEIEAILHSYTDPLFKVAHLNPKDLRLIIVVSKDVNASATFNTTITVLTGFLLKTERVDEIIGVFAHEIGHLAGNHLMGLTDAIDNAQKTSLLGTLAGVTLGVLTGRPDIALFSLAGGQATAIYSFSQFNRGQEAAADRMAIRFLHELCWPVDGLASFLHKLHGQELLRESQQDPYLRTHPLTQDRVTTVHHAQETSCSKPFPKEMLENYAILKMKLDAFLSPPYLVLEKYKGEGFLNHYAQVIAYYRLSDIGNALRILDGLLKSPHASPYLWELKGQILYEHGKLKESIFCYEKALSLSPESPLLMLGLAQSLIGLENKKVLGQAERVLRKMKEHEPENALVLHYLSIVYGRQERMGEMALSLAEKEALLGNWAEAKNQADRALHFLKPKDHAYLKAQDLKNHISQEMDKKTKTQKF
ncbi:MAG: M48 family metalloprotease [Alphaproteobacteria bacterium]